MPRKLQNVACDHSEFVRFVGELGGLIQARCRVCSMRWTVCDVSGLTGSAFAKAHKLVAQFVEQP